MGKMYLDRAVTFYPSGRVKSNSEGVKSNMQVLHVENNNEEEEMNNSRL